MLMCIKIYRRKVELGKFTELSTFHIHIHGIQDDRL